MAMTLRLPEELDEQLNALAARRRLSKQQLVMQALTEYVAAYDHAAAVSALAEKAAVDYSETLRRLGE